MGGWLVDACALAALGASTHTYAPPHPPTQAVASEAASARGLDVGALIHRYGKEFLYKEPPLALEYYMLAAAAMGDTLQARGVHWQGRAVGGARRRVLLCVWGEHRRGGRLAAHPPHPTHPARC